MAQICTRVLLAMRKRIYIKFCIGMVSIGDDVTRSRSIDGRQRTSYKINDLYQTSRQLKHRRTCSVCGLILCTTPVSSMIMLCA